MIVLKRTRKKKNTEKSLIPLINIVFLLLIFFIITANFNQHLSHSIPKTLQLKEQVMMDEIVMEIHQANPIVVTLKEQTIAISQLAQWLTHKRIDSIVIQSHPSLPAKTLVSVIQTLRQANVKNIQLLAKNQS